MQEKRTMPFMSYHFTQDTLSQAYKSNTWETALTGYISKNDSPFTAQPYMQEKQFQLHHRDCVLVPVTKHAVLFTYPAIREALPSYTHEKDTAMYSATEAPTLTEADTGFFLIPPKVPYSLEGVSTIFRIPEYSILPTTSTIQVRCFAMLQKFSPHNAEAFPIQPAWTYLDVIDALGMERSFARIIFVNNKATAGKEIIQPNSVVTFFPGIGGG